MASPKIVSSKCPTCGANLPVHPGVTQVTCRYCQNVIHVEHRKPPPEVRPFGSPGAMPSRVLYVDPNAAAAAGKSVAAVIAITVLLPILLPILIFAVPVVTRSLKGSVKPFPATCAVNEKLTLSGNYETTGPLVTSVGSNCKLHIKNAKLKGSKLVDTNSFNLELTLENVTIETTEAMVTAGSNLKAKISGSTLKSADTVFETEANMTLDIDDSTLESTGSEAIEAKSNLKVRLENGKIRGKKAGIDSESSLQITMKKGSEITSSDGIAIKTTSGFKLDADDGKLEASEGAIVSSSSTAVKAKGLLISSKRRAIVSSSSLKLDLEGGSITSLEDIAIETDSSADLDFEGTIVQGATSAISCSSNAKIRGARKARIVGASGYGVDSTLNTELTLEDASVEAGGVAFKGSSNSKLRLGQSARLVGKKGGVASETNLQLEATGATIEGGSGPGIASTFNTRLRFRQGVLIGSPAIHLDRKPIMLELEGTKVSGGTRIPAR